MRLKIIVLAALMAISASSAFAQSCSGTAASNLLTCSHLSLETCRADGGCVNDKAQALSTQDVLEAAAAKCCPLSSKKEKVCIAAYQKTLERTRLFAPSAVQRFLSAARTKVGTLRTNGCSTGSLGED